VESYPPITLVLVHIATNNVFIINNDQIITFLGHTIPLIIVWALRPLIIVTIHYLKWGFKTWGVTGRDQKTTRRSKKPARAEVYVPS
jgi:hypothetical protein